MTHYFTSDWHLGHRNVAGHRGAVLPVTDWDVANHDQAILDRCSALRKDDILWILGDLCMSQPGSALSLISLLPGRKRLILGNHDRGHPMHRDAHRWAPAYAVAFEYVSQSARVRLDGTEFLLSHFPYERDRGPVRHMQWRLPDLGTPLLHGHTHGTERVSLSLAGSVEIHVGVDAWPGLVSADDVLRLFRDPP